MCETCKEENMSMAAMVIVVVVVVLGGVNGLNQFSDYDVKKDIDR